MCFKQSKLKKAIDRLKGVGPSVQRRFKNLRKGVGPSVNKRKP